MSKRLPTPNTPKSITQIKTSVLEAQTLDGERQPVIQLELTVQSPLSDSSEQLPPLIVDLSGARDLVWAMQVATDVASGGADPSVISH